MYSISTTGEAPTAIAVADFNGDGKPDLAAANFANQSALFYGNGDGTLQNAVILPVKNAGARSVVSADFDGNGSPDVEVVIVFSRVAILLNTQ